VSKKIRAMVAGVLTVAVLMTTFAAAASGKFDGPWSVVVYTSSGKCDPSYRFNGQITNGEIFYAYGSLEVVGRVVESGAVFVKVTSNSGHAEAHGHFTPTQGNGTWSGAGPDGRCGGTWTATRAGNG
jgi:hypothetical protein